MTAKVEQWRALAQQEIDAQGSPIPVELALAIIENESSGTAKAYRAEKAISDGSIGLMQLLLSTARSLGYTGQAGDPNTLSGLFDPQTNIHLGVKFLTSLWNSLDTISDVISAYNGGVRPNLGFGGVLPEGHAPVTVCLERDDNGNCIRKQFVNPGEYGNPQYVQNGLDAMERYGYDFAANEPSDGTDAPPSGDTGIVPAGFASPAILGVLALVGVGFYLYTRGKS